MHEVIEETGLIGAWLKPAEFAALTLVGVVKVALRTSHKGRPKSVAK